MDGSARIALEVVMVSLTRDLIPGRITGHLDCGEPSVFHQTADISVDSGDA
jgi:hypothetical protein